MSQLIESEAGRDEVPKGAYPLGILLSSIHSLPLLGLQAGITKFTYDAYAHLSINDTRTITAGIYSLLFLFGAYAQKKTLEEHEYSSDPVATWLYEKWHKTIPVILTAQVIGYLWSVKNPVDMYAAFSGDEKTILADLAAKTIMGFGIYAGANFLILSGKVDPAVKISSKALDIMGRVGNFLADKSGLAALDGFLNPPSKSQQIYTDHPDSSLRKSPLSKELEDFWGNKLFR